jgi:hypothetical protein
MRVSAKNLYLDLFGLKNADGKNSFSREDLSTIVDAVIKHDDKGSNQPSGSSKVLSLFQDIDTTWVPSFLSVVQNYAGRYGRPDSNMAPVEFLRMRQSYFFDIGEDVAHGQMILINPDSDTKYKSKKFSIAHRSAKQVIAAEMLARTEECNVGIFDYVSQGDWPGFQKFAVHFLENSIEAVKKGITFDFMLYHTP